MPLEYILNRQVYYIYFFVQIINLKILINYICLMFINSK